MTLSKRIQTFDNEGLITGKYIDTKCILWTSQDLSYRKIHSYDCHTFPNGTASTSVLLIYFLSRVWPIQICTCETAKLWKSLVEIDFGMQGLITGRLCQVLSLQS